MTDTETTPGGREVQAGQHYVGAGRELRIRRIVREKSYPEFVIEERARPGLEKTATPRWSEQTVNGATLDNRLTGMSTR